MGGSSDREEECGVVVGVVVVVVRPLNGSLIVPIATVFMPRA